MYLQGAKVQVVLCLPCGLEAAQGCVRMRIAAQHLCLLAWRYNLQDIHQMVPSCSLYTTNHISSYSQYYHTTSNTRSNIRHHNITRPYTLQCMQDLCCCNALLGKNTAVEAFMMLRCCSWCGCIVSSSIPAPLICCPSLVASVASSPPIVH